MNHNCQHEYEQERIEADLYNAHFAGRCAGAPECAYCLDEKNGLKPKEGDMSILQAPPNNPQIAAANDYLFAILEAVKLAQTKIISRNLMMSGTISEQEAFALTWSEIRGIAARALATGTAEDAIKARLAVNHEVDRRILENPAYDKFKTATAGTDDPLMR